MNNNWISVNDRLPKENIRVLAFINHSVIICDYSSKSYNQKGFWFNENENEYEYNYNEDITYWQPLPEPPKDK